MRSHGDLSGLVKFLARDDWKSSFEEVMGEHLGPAMQAFDLEYEAIGAAPRRQLADDPMGRGVRGLSRPTIRAGRP
jgi:hypothetical protein